ncbi:hypothetical protein Leryth_004441 [Lithospermum erythrorhizon]|nr:hypothetical protein Leryth_004441 [Lithospermum erythrorhizon]
MANRSSGHEGRRDTKWSSRWGPDEKESRGEKKDADKEDPHTEKQSFVVSNHSTFDRDLDSRDKWKPRHRMEGNSTGTGSYRAAPGFALERGRVEVTNLGFTVGRGRSNVSIIRPPVGSIGSSECDRTEAVPGRLPCPADSYCYPRGKLLDIYRQKKLDPSSWIKPEDLEEAIQLTQINKIEPLAFVVPDAEEEAVLDDIWRGKLTSSGISRNSYRKGRLNDNGAEVGDSDYSSEKGVILPSATTEESFGTIPSAPTDELHKSVIDGMSYHNERIMHEGKNGIVEGKVGVGRGELLHATLKQEEFQSLQATGNALQPEALENATTSPLLNTKFATSFEANNMLPDESLVDMPYSKPYWDDNTNKLQSRSNVNQSERGIPPEELNLPVRLADAPEESLQAIEGKREGEHRGPDLVTVVLSSSALDGSSQKHSKFDQLSQSQALNSHDFTAHDEEIMFPGTPSSGSNLMGTTLTGSGGGFARVVDVCELEGTSRDNQELRLFRIEAEGVQLSNHMGGKSPFGVMADSARATESWPEAFRRNSLSEPNLIQDAMDSRHSYRGDLESNRFDLRRPNLLCPRINFQGNKLGLPCSIST